MALYVNGVTLHHNQHPGNLIEELLLPPEQATQLLESTRKVESRLAAAIGVPIALVPVGDTDRDLVPVVVGDDPRR